MGRSDSQKTYSLIKGGFFSGLLFIAAANLTACGGGSGGGEPAPMRTSYPKMNFESCAPANVAELEEVISKGSPPPGPTANHASKTEWVESAFFKKPYDRYDLEAVLDLRTVYTATYIRSLGITLHKAPRPTMDGKCPMYFYLDKSPEKLQEIWNKAAGQTDGEKNTDLKLSGLYFEFCGRPGTPSCAQRAMVNPTILVDEGADRWTLVHELMHYNFDQGRKASTALPTDVYLARAQEGYKQDMIGALKAYQALPNRDDLQQVANFLGHRITVGKEVYVRSALEEISIEGMLTELWFEGKLTNVRDRDNVEYMKLSRDKFFESLVELEEGAKAIKTEAEAKFWPEIATTCDELLTRLNSYRTETQAMIDKADEQVRSRNMGGLTAFGDSPAFFSAGEEEEPSFNVVNFEKEIHAHLAMHDPAKLEATFVKDSKEISDLMREIF